MDKLLAFKVIPSIGWRIVFDIPKEELGEGLEKIQIYNLIITLCSILLLVLLLTLVLNKLLGPVNETVTALEDISRGEGDLTKRISAPNLDEIGALTSAFNLFQDKLCTIIADARDYSEKVDQASGHMLALSRDVSSDSEAIAGQTYAMETSANEVNANMEAIASSVEESNTNLGMIASAVEEMSLTINEISANSAKAKEISENAVSVSDITF